MKPCLRWWCLLAGAMAWIAMTGLGRAAEPMSNRDCLECHSDKELFKTNAAGRAVSLFVDEARFLASAHRTNTGASCHDDLKKTHPDDEVAARPVDCAKCHERQST